MNQHHNNSYIIHRSEGVPERDIYSLGALDYWPGLGQEFFRRRRRRRRRPPKMVKNTKTKTLINHT